LGVDRDRRAAAAACAASLNIVSYMPEITVNETLAAAAAEFESTRTPEKPVCSAPCAKIFFRNCAKHRLFSMLFSAPS
jgi:hypothetical protein